jgi:single-strand DNA-binding protein
MLRVTLLGNLGADPDTRFTATGAPAVVFNVAINQVRKGPDGERQESTEWFRVHVSGKRAEFAQRLTRGNKVMVAGRLVIGHYVGKDGDQRTSYDVWADDFEGMSPRPRDTESLMEADADAPAEPVAAGVSSLAGTEEPRAAATSGARGRGTNGRTQAAGTAPEDLEDLPF